MAYPAKLSRSTIIQAALKMVEEDAAEPPSLRAIARRLHVATNALYNYFPDRSELNAAIAVAGSRKMLSSLKRAVGSAEGRDALDRFSKAFLRFTRTHVPVRLRADFPLAQVQPLPRIALTEATLGTFDATADMAGMDAVDWDDYETTIAGPNADLNRGFGNYAVAARKRIRSGCPFEAASG